MKITTHQSDASPDRLKAELHTRNRSTRASLKNKVVPGKPLSVDDATKLALHCAGRFSGFAYFNGPTLRPGVGEAAVKDGKLWYWSSLTTHGTMIEVVLSEDGTSHWVCSYPVCI